MEIKQQACVKMFKNINNNTSIRKRHLILLERQQIDIINNGTDKIILKGDIPIKPNKKKP